MRDFLKRIAPLLASIYLALVSVLVVNIPLASADFTVSYNPSYLISDDIFTDTSSMSAGSIQSFLKTEGSGLVNYSAVENCSTIKQPYSGTYYPHCGSSESAATIIYDAAQAYGINPRAILATMEKEQSLVTTPDPTASQLNCAMGYESCNSTYLGFFNQVDNASWQLKADIELMDGQDWWGYTPSHYVCSSGTSLYSTGLYPGSTVRFTNPGYSGDPAGTNGDPITLTLANSATAALYCYTPYVGPYSQTGYSGSYNFVYYFELWFGSVASPCYNDSEVSGSPTGASVLRDHTSAGGGPDNLTLTLANNTGSACAEAHVWKPGFQSFQNDYATNLPVFNSATGQIISADLGGNGQDQLVYVAYTSTGSGHIEIHVWNPGLNKFDNDYVTNLSSVSPTNGRVISGDFYGNGKDELAYVAYTNTGSGHIEIHVWNSNFSGFTNDYVTSLPDSPPTTGQVLAANLSGSGANQLVYVVYQNSGSGKIEVHVWKPGYQSFQNDYITNLAENPPTVGQVLAADVSGSGKDNLIYDVIEHSGSGKIEVHVWNSSFSGFVNDYATNVSEINNN